MHVELNSLINMDSDIQELQYILALVSQGLLTSHMQFDFFH